MNKRLGNHIRAGLHVSNKLYTGENIECTHISILKPPSKLVYLPGETFVSDGMIVKAVYSDGTSRLITDFSVNPAVAMGIEQKYVEIEYGHVSVKQAVSMVKELLADIPEILAIEGNLSIHYELRSKNDNSLGMKFEGHLDQLIGNYGSSDYVLKVKLHIPSICSSLGITKSDLSGLTVDFYGERKPNSVTDYEVCDYEGTTVLLRRQIEKEDASTIYTVPLQDFMSLENIPDEFGFTVRIPDAYYDQDKINREHIKLRVSRLSDINTFTSSSGFNSAACDYGDNPKINLANGGLKYLMSDMSIGKNSYTIGVSHIYDSRPAGAASALFTTCGNGWKLDIDQWLVKRTVNGETGYFYYDETGIEHYFILFDKINKRYFDRNDPGVTLKEQTDGALMKDSKGNVIKFDGNGRIDYTAAALNNLIKKKFLYDDRGRVRQIYDERNANGGLPTHHISFEYGDDGRLNYMTAEYNNKKVARLQYCYNVSGNLSSIVKYAYDDNGTVIDNEECVRLQYSDAGMLLLCCDVESKAAVKITYDSFLRAVKVAHGITDGENISGKADECGFVEKTFNQIKSVHYREQTGVREAFVLNERGISSCMQLSPHSGVVSIFETEPYGALKTLEKEPGVKIGLNGDCAEFINGEKAKSVNGIFSKTGIVLTRLGEDSYLNYILSFYVKLNAQASGRARAQIEYNSKTEYKLFDGTASGVWQKITLPVSFVNENEKRNFAFNLRIIEGNNTSLNAKICCMRMLPGGSQKLRLTGIGFDFAFAKYENNTIKMISQESNSLETFNGYQIPSQASGYYLSENDFLRAYTDRLRGENFNGVTTYDLICNDGTVRLPLVTGVMLNAAAGTFNVFSPSGNAECYQETISPDNKSRTRQSFLPERTLKGSKLTVTNIVNTFKNGIGGTASDEDRTSQKSVALDEYGRVTIETDSYGVAKIYEYDNNTGDLNYGLTKRVYFKKGNMSMPVSEAKYDDKKEYNTASTDGVNASIYSYHKAFGAVEKVTEGSKEDFDAYTGSQSAPVEDSFFTRYGYDNYKDKLLWIEKSTGFTSQRNNFTYQNGSLRTVTDGCIKYGIKLDPLNSITEFTVFNGDNEQTMLQKSVEDFDRNTRTTIARAKFYNTLNMVSGESVLISDKYNRIKSGMHLDAQGQEQGNSSFDYEVGNGESEAAGKLKKIIDNYENTNYNYRYDESGCLVSWSCVEGSQPSGNNKLAVRQISASDTKYSFGSETDPSGSSFKEKFIVRIEHDKDKTIDPRVTKTEILYDRELDDDEPPSDWAALPIFSRAYIYDDLGRMTGKNVTGASDVRMTYEYYDTQNGAAKTVSPLLKKYVYKHDTDSATKYSEITYNIEYDEKNRISKTIRKHISKQAQSGHHSPFPNASETNLYSYDNLGRLTSETKNGVRTAYEYDSTGRITKRGNYRYEYYQSGRDKGRLMSTSDGYFEYDNYGNRISEKDSSGVFYPRLKYEYTRGNLLKGIQRHVWPQQIAEYSYNHQGVRYRKIAGDLTSNYYLDGGKVLGEDRSDGIKLRYFYDTGGLSGFIKELNGVREYYTYVKDMYGNIVMLENGYGPIAKYEYNSLGKVTTYGNFMGEWYDVDARTGIILELNRLPEWQKVRDIANLNPFRWKSHYYDTESGFYYANGRYYDPGIGMYIDADDAENILEAAGSTNCLDPNLVVSDYNMLKADANWYDVYTIDSMTADITYDPYRNVTWWERNWLNVIMLGLQAVAGLLMCLFPCTASFGIMMLGGAVMGGLGMALNELCPAVSRVLSGLGIMSAGGSTVMSGIGLMCSGTLLGFIVGAVCLAVGAVTAAIGANEVIAGATGINYLQKWTGMTDENYTKLCMVINIANAVCSIAGSLVRAFKGIRCFIAGTLIVTAAGLKKIEDIEVGDTVLSFDEETGERAFKRVLQVFRNETLEWCHVSIEGMDEPIVSTPGHKYYLPENTVCREVGEKHEHAGYDELSVKWVSACNLKKGDKVLLSDGKYAIVSKIESKHLSEPETTYNFETEDFHTYYVGEKGVCVHNINCQTTVETIETKAPNQMKMSDATQAWDDFLGAGQHNTNPLTGKPDVNRIFSADSTRSIRFSPHEMRSLGTTKAHFHFETWSYNANTNHMTIYNVLQRLRF